MKIEIQSDDWWIVESIAERKMDNYADAEQIAFEAYSACAAIARILLAFKPKDAD